MRLIQIWPFCGCAARACDVQADVARAGEGDEARLGMRHQAVAEGGAGAGAEVDHPAGMPASSSASKNFAAMVGESLDGFRTTVLPQTRLAPVMPSQMARGKFHGGITAPTPSGM